MKAKKTLGTVLTSLGFVVGFAALTSAAPNSSIDTTGPDSVNKIKNTSRHDLKIRNHNKLNVWNSNDQRAHSGNAESSHNTTGGGASTGDARNSNSLSASATVNNSSATHQMMGGSGGGNSNATTSIENTGPDSINKVVNKVTSVVDIENNNNLNVDNTNYQTATTGHATVHGNTTGGSAVSGDAANTNSTSTTFHVTN
ncbi:hypothetical protein H7X68_01690 [Candidatus Saccharibacteria bacterium]|nr:hypothetical protein [Candidatus Saccharibacteria bacterium]